MGGGEVRAFELLAEEDEPPRLSLVELPPCGDGSIELLPPALAEKVSAQVREGVALEQALPADRLGLRPDWRAQLDLQGALAGHRVVIVPAKGRPGPHLAIRLERGGEAVTLARIDRGAQVALAALPGGWRAVARVEGPGTLRDVRLLDLAAGARELETARAAALLDAGDARAAIDAARSAIGRGERACTQSGAPAFVLARALLAAGASEGKVLQALESAIEVDPTLWRMRARTAPDLAGLRGLPAFDALVAPRRLR